METWKQLIPNNIVDKYELYNVNNAVEILTQSFPSEYQEIISALENFNLVIDDIVQSGGNESSIPKKLSALMRPMGWKETAITGDLIIKLYDSKKTTVYSEFSINEYISGHMIDYVKNGVAIDMEWNSKDQTFDRDLLAFRAFYECGVIACGVIITRSESLNKVFTLLGKEIKSKYGASTTWVGKLTTRIQSRRHGGCPILIVGITPNTISDWGGNEDVSK